MLIKSVQYISAVTVLNIGLIASIPVWADTTLVNPDAQTRRILLDHLSKTTPNFDAIAQKSALVLQADEFTRQAVKTTEIERLQALWDNFNTTDALQFNIKVNLGEYNAAAAGFPVSVFAPGTYVQGEIPITFSNSSEMSIFPVPLGQGSQTLGLLDAARSAVANVTLRDLAPSQLTAGAIEGRVSEVVISNRAGTEIGRYSSVEILEGKKPSDRPTPKAAGDSLASSLGVPAAGATWAEILPFLQKQGFVSGAGQNFSGELFKIVNGKLTSPKPLDRYQNLTLGFGKNEQTAVSARKELTRRSVGFDAPKRPFGKLDCFTPNETDSCGVIQLERREGQLVLVDMMVLVQAMGVEYGTPISSFPFEEGTIEKMDVADTQVGYLNHELGGANSAGAAAKVYWSGELVNTPAPLHDLRTGFADTFAADVMLWLIDGQDAGTIIVARSSLPTHQ
jgi:hypothetical protein